MGANYKNIQAIRKLYNAMMQHNYLQIKQDVLDIIVGLRRIAQIHRNQYGFAKSQIKMVKTYLKHFILPIFAYVKREEDKNS